MWTLNGCSAFELKLQQEKAQGEELIGSAFSTCGFTEVQDRGSGFIRT